MRDKNNYYLFAISGPFCEIPRGYFRGLGDLYIPVGFVILEIEEDTQTPIILGRPFLATTECLIDVKNGTLSFDVGDDHVEFNLLKAVKYPSIFDECNKIDVVNGLIRETMCNLNSNDPLEHLMLNNSITKDENPEVAKCAQLLETFHKFHFPLLR